jgi:hypothetical protein
MKIKLGKKLLAAIGNTAAGISLAKDREESNAKLIEYKDAFASEALEMDKALDLATEELTKNPLSQEAATAFIAAFTARGGSRRDALSKVTHIIHEPIYQTILKDSVSDLRQGIKAKISLYEEKRKQVQEAEKEHFERIETDQPGDSPIVAALNGRIEEGRKFLERLDKANDGDDASFNRNHLAKFFYYVSAEIE